MRTALIDPALQAYAQQYPFLTGPDRDLNRRALRAVQESIKVTVSTREVPIRVRPGADLALPASQEKAACDLLRSVGVPAAEVEHARRDYSWRAAPVPEDTASILCLGSGAGDELAFLRARAPAARIVVLDYVSKLRSGLAQVARVEFVQCDLVAELEVHEDRYDVVFSNHTLEHLFEPDRVLQLIGRRICDGGLLVSGLPLDGDASTPLHHDVVAMSSAAGALHALDMGVFDVGHPWKTNAADLTETLTAAGFSDVVITQREDEPHRAFADPSGARPGVSRTALEAAYRTLFAPTRRVLRALLVSTAPLGVCRALVALERRVPFGAGRLKNGFSPDVVVCARPRSPAVSGSMSCLSSVRSATRD